MPYKVLSDTKLMRVLIKNNADQKDSFKNENCGFDIFGCSFSIFSSLFLKVIYWNGFSTWTILYVYVF